MDPAAPLPSRPFRFGLVGGGWRAAFFVRVAAALPELFAPPSIAVRRADAAARLARRFQRVVATPLWFLGGE